MITEKLAEKEVDSRGQLHDLTIVKEDHLPSETNEEETKEEMEERI